MMFRLSSTWSLRIFAATFLASACFFTSCGKTSTPQPTAAAPLHPAAFAFDTPQLKQRFELFDAVAKEFAPADQGWKHRGYSAGGNFITAVWAQGKGFDDQCRLNHEPADQVGIHKLEVDTIVVGDKAKSAAFTVERIDKSPSEWSVMCYYREATEQGVTGAGWSARLFKWDEGKQKTYIPFRPYEQTTAVLDLGPVYGYQIENTPVQVVSQLSLEKDLVRYLASPESLRDSYLNANAKLLKKVEEKITSHQAEKRLFGKYEGEGLPPPTSVRPLTTEEEAGELSKARAHFARLNQLVNDDHAALHAALRKAFPFEKCWPELLPPTK